MKALISKSIDIVRGGNRDPIAFVFSFAMLLTLPLYLSGPVRSATHLDATVSLLICCLLSAGLVAVAWKALKSSPPPLTSIRWWGTSTAFELAVLFLPAFCIWRLWNADFAGFPNIDGWDGGTHVFVKDRFINENPGEYFGFVSQYSFTYWVSKLFRIDGFRAVAVSFYFAVATLAGTVSLIAVATVRTQFRGKKIATLAAIIAMIAIGMRFFDGGALIALHYLQGMGFYPQVFAIIGLCAIWSADALVQSPILRVIGTGAATVLLRYSYGLNLPDAVAAIGILYLLEARAARYPAMNCIVGVGTAFAAYNGFIALEPLFILWGGLAQHSVPQSLSVNLSTALVMAVIVALLASETNSIVRAVRFPLVFAVVNAASGSYFQSIATQYYYANKYQFASCCLLCGAAVVVAAHTAGELVVRVSAFKLRSWQGSLAVVLAALFVLLMSKEAPADWKHVYARYLVSYKERVNAKGAPYAMLRPLADTRALRRIKAVLKQEQKEFGGYLTNNFPLFSFMNGTLAYHTSIQTFFPPNKSAGHCAFWVSPEDDTIPNGPAAELNAWRVELAASGGAVCEKYSVRWKLTTQSLCYVCF